MASPFTQGLLLRPGIVTEQQALKIYNKALSLVLEGKTYMQWNGNGEEFSAAFPINVGQMLSEAAYCLQSINPAKYGYICTELKPIFV